MKKRADIILYEKGLVDSREKGKRVIMEGSVFVGNVRFGKQGERLDEVAEGKFTWESVVDNFYRDFHRFLLVAEKEIDKIEIKDEVTDEICEKCGKNMVIKSGRYGKFLACPGYPDCKNTKPILDKINVGCPLCDGEIIRKKSKRGRAFYGCTNYPKCNFVSWDEPIEERCPQCNSYMTIKRNKKGNTIRCSNKDCGYTKKESEK